MTADLILVTGVTLGVLGFPALLSAWTHGQGMVRALAMIAAAVALIVVAESLNPLGYSVRDVPEVFVRVIARFVN